jgi:hypothetical protein
MGLIMVAVICELPRALERLACLLLGERRRSRPPREGGSLGEEAVWRAHCHPAAPALRVDIAEISMAQDKKRNK